MSERFKLRESLSKESEKKKKKDALRRPIFVGISLLSNSELLVAIKDGEALKIETVSFPTSRRPQAAIYRWINKYMSEHYVKIVALGIGNGGLAPTKEEAEDLASRLWLRQDIVPFIFKFSASMNAEQKAVMAVNNVASQFKHNQEVDIHFDPQRKVLVSSLARLEDYKRTVPAAEFSRLVELAEITRNKMEKIRFFSSTPRGGGVALMRHALIRLFRLLQVDVHWYVMSSEKKTFLITKKKIHNVLQGVASREDELTATDKQTYENWIKRNVKRFTPVFKRATTIVIDDPQPSGMISYIKEINPEARIIYRSHIQIESKLVAKKGTMQQRTWDYLWKNISQADLFISHPVREFIPNNVDPMKLVLMGATTDEIDGLNKKLSSWQVNYYLGLLNDALEKVGQTSLDKGRPFITQIARFDPSKGIPDVLESYRLLRERLNKEGWEKKNIPQLIIAGHGAMDDPEGVPLFSDTLNRLKTDSYAPYVNDIKVIRLHHSDQILNAVLSKCKIALQLSNREGYEIKVSEALAKGKPIVAYRAGGIPLQIEHEVTGYLVEVGKTEKVAEHLHQLLKDRNLYNTISFNAKERVRRDSFTVTSAIRWLELSVNKKISTPIVFPELSFLERFVSAFKLQMNFIKEAMLE